MTIEYLKRATAPAETAERDLRDTVQALLDELEQGGDQVACAFARKFDRWEGDILVSGQTIAAAEAQLPEDLKADIRFAHDNIRRFAEAPGGSGFSLSH